MSLPYCNNLKKGDHVLDVVSKTRGKVAADPRENATTASVSFGISIRRIPVADLRLIVDGVPEDVPPCNGTPPQRDEAPARPRYEKMTPMQARIAGLEADLRDLDLGFAEYHKSRKRIVAAIEALKAVD